MKQWPPRARSHPPANRWFALAAAGSWTPTGAATERPMRLLDRILQLLWDPSGERQRAQDARMRQAIQVVRDARRVKRRADRITRLRTSAARAGGRLGR